MSKYRRKYTKEQKLEIVLISFEEGQKITDVAERYDLHPNTLYNWRSDYVKYQDRAFPGKGNVQLTDEQQQIADLKKRLREAELERDILKKAVGIFSKKGSKYSDL